MDTLNTLPPATPGFDWALFRRDVRRDVRNCVLFLFFYYAVSMLVTAIIIAAKMLQDQLFLDALSNPAFMAAMLAGEPWAMEEFGGALNRVMQNANVAGLISIAGIIIGSCVFLLWRKRRFVTDIAMPAAEPMTAKIFLILIVITQAFQCVYGLLVQLIDSLMPGGLSMEESYDSAMSGLISPVGLVYVVLIGPIFEELIFRGAILGALRKFGNNFAIIFSSILFGFYHMIVLQIPFAFVLGLILGYVAVRWSLRASIALHIVVNGLSTLFTSASGDLAMGLIGLAMILCVIAAIVMARVWRKQLAERVRAGAAYYARTYENGFASIAFWVFIFVMSTLGFFQMALMSGV